MNHKTGERMVLTFKEKQGNTNSTCSGKVFDASGRHVLTISGSWLHEIKIKDLRTGEEEKVWEEQPLIPDAHLQFFYNYTSVQMNQKVDNMYGVVSPTDTRWRNDLRLFEEGDWDEADNVKVKIEEEQRRKRAYR